MTRRKVEPEGSSAQTEKPDKPARKRDANGVFVGVPYTPEMDKRAAKAAALGATNRDIAEILGISKVQFYAWRNEHPSFAEAVTVGKGPADQRVVRSLYERATGYTYIAQELVKTKDGAVVIDVEKHVPPDTVAAIYWTKNRMPDEWKDRTEKKHTGNVTVEHEDADQARAVIARFLESEKQKVEGTKH